jgi:hypothetical protein
MRLIENDKQASSYLLKELNQLDMATKKIENSGVKNLEFNIFTPSDLIDYSSNTIINSIDAEKFDQVINFLKTQRKEFTTLYQARSSLTLAANISGEVDSEEDVEVKSSKTRTVFTLLVPQSWDGRNSFVTVSTINTGTSLFETQGLVDILNVNAAKQIVDSSLAAKNKNGVGSAGITISKNERAITITLYHNNKPITLPFLEIKAKLWRTI